jgi:hypothetical protein
LVNHEIYTIYRPVIDETQFLHKAVFIQKIMAGKPFFSAGVRYGNTGGDESAGVIRVLSVNPLQNGLKQELHCSIQKGIIT